MNEPKGYWTSVFYQATMLMRQKPQIGGENAFWMARSMVDQNLEMPQAAYGLGYRSQAEGRQDQLVLAP